MKENRILYDWFSCTSKVYNVEEFISRLGMVNCDWRTARGAHGYKDKLTFGGCSVHYNGSENMGTWLEMSGEGCRSYESYGNDLWDLLFLGILQDDSNAHFTRLDVAFDDFTGILDINEIIRDTFDGNFISKSSYHRITVSSDGNSCQFGKSDVVIRIYDKAAEQKLTDGTHWVRVEIQLRDDRAKAWIKNMVPFGGLFKSVLYNYLRFVEPNPLDLEHKSRWNIV